MKETISKNSQDIARYNMIKSLVVAGIGCAVAGFMYTLDLVDWITYILADFISGITIAYTLGQVIPLFRNKGLHVGFGFSIGSILYLTIGSAIYHSLPKGTNDFISNLVFNLFWIITIPTVIIFFIRKNKQISRKVFGYWLLATMLAVIFWSLQQIDITLSNMIGMAIFGILGCYLTLREAINSPKYFSQPEHENYVASNNVSISPIKIESTPISKNNKSKQIDASETDLSQVTIETNPQTDAEIKSSLSWKIPVFSLLALAIVFWLIIAPNSNKNKLVGRHPQQWIPNSKAFSAIDNIVPLEGNFAYLKERDSITSYGYYWNEPSCSKAQSSNIALGEVYVLLYKSTSDAQNVYSEITPSFSNVQPVFLYQKTSDLQTGNKSEIWFYEYSSCDQTAYFAITMFRRNNVIGVVNAETFENNYEFLAKVILDLGSQLDQIIQDEIKSHPGSESDIAGVISSAKAIELPSSTNQSANNSGGNNDYSGTSDSSTGQCYMDSYGNCHAADQCAQIVNGTCILLPELMEQIEKDSQQNSSP